MKLPYLMAYAQMLPVLQAREALHTMTVIALGTNTVRKTDASRIRASWQDTASTVKPLDPAKSPELARARIEAMGFKVS